ncbi:MAG: ribose-5-phosphate isomerase RpiA [Xanthomonadales bacterium]|nr:ribose-5-phosphate isomerase RpiA [Gammaproteobacteria bacterium]MBT8052664.1 ribose-5-phosphate isomerase RpiA [Gammaproteobacteria bacterium]NND56577.1 ribose-5-phosphate isomerase RpiA [Xanthomonadales bacterium]NNK52481.1 ribose-5-phosphate isomerase RpiA [Xanthomonadales bacterium]
MTSAVDQQIQKQWAAEAAVRYVRPDSVLGVGTGSTVNLFIEALAASGTRIEAAVSSSDASTRLLESNGITVRDLNLAGTLDLYIDGADEFDPHRRLIKGGGGALTREKIVTAASRKFVCIVDESKKVGVLGKYPLPVEVIPMARSFVARQLVAMGGQPELRQDFVTDNGNVILDVHNMDLVDPVAVEKELNNLPGVVTNGLWAIRPADVVLMATSNGVEEFS